MSDDEAKVRNLIGNSVNRDLIEKETNKVLVEVSKVVVEVQKVLGEVKALRIWVIAALTVAGILVAIIGLR